MVESSYLKALSRMIVGFLVSVSSAVLAKLFGWRNVSKSWLRLQVTVGVTRSLKQHLSQVIGGTLS